MTRRTFVRCALATSFVGAVGAPLVACGLDTHQVDVTYVPVKLGLNKPLRIAALGDIHFDPLYEEEYLAAVFSHISTLRADMVLFTGDFVTHRALRMGDLAELMTRATSRLGSFAAMGNHDHWSGVDAVKSALKRNGIHVLCNESFALPDEDSVYLTGLDSFWAGRPDTAVFSRTPAHARHILLVHEPDAFTPLNDPRIRLQVSGHTHGGQVRLPLVGALCLPKWGKQFDAGLFTQNTRSLYVNRGIGSLFPHVRYACQPELTVFEVS